MIDHIPRAFINKSLTENQKVTLFIRYYIQNHIIRERCIDQQCREVAEHMTMKGYLISAKTVKYYYYKDLKN